MHTREISEQKEESERKLWIYDEDVNNAIKVFVKAQKNSKF